MKGGLPSFLHANWLAAAQMHAAGERKAAGAILAYLRAQLPRLDAGGLAWMINALRVMGVPAEHVVITDAARRLDGLRRDDGRWASDDGEWPDVPTTLEAMRALLQGADRVQSSRSPRRALGPCELSAAVPRRYVGGRARARATGRPRPRGNRRRRG